MPNPRFYAGDLEEATYTMSLTEVVAFPLANLANYDPNSLWKSSANTKGQTLNIDFGSAKARNFVVIDGNNFDSMISVNLQVGVTDDGAFASPTTVTTLHARGDEPVKVDFSSVTKRYWRILFTNTSSIVPQLGQIFINQAFDAGKHYEFPYSAKDEIFETSRARALNGFLRTSQSYKGILTWQIRFKNMNETFAASWLRFHQKVRGSMLPFYYVDPDDAMFYVLLSGDQNDLERFRYQLNNLGVIRLETQSVHQNPLS